MTTISEDALKQAVMQFARQPSTRSASRTETEWTALSEIIEAYATGRTLHDVRVRAAKVAVCEAYLHWAGYRGSPTDSVAALTVVLRKAVDALRKLEAQQ